MHDFEFHRPASLADALAVLRTDPESKLLGGGQSLLPVLKLGLAQPSRLVSLSRLEELRGLRRDGSTLVIGAGHTHSEVAASEAVRAAIPALAALAGAIGDPQVRNRGTLGGSVAHNDPAADYPAALLALGATVQTDRRRIAAEDFFHGMFATALAPDEVVVAVHFPIPDTAAYAKFANPASKYAIAGVMVAKRGTDVRVAVTGAGPGVFRATALEEALSARFSAGALDGLQLASEELTGDLDASAEYRAHLVVVMARRAVAACA
jgi:aerobic carbon-monoxide dehydrogenase medium subunit